MLAGKGPQQYSAERIAKLAKLGGLRDVDLAKPQGSQLSSTAVEPQCIAGYQDLGPAQSPGNQPMRSSYTGLEYGPANNTHTHIRPKPAVIPSANLLETLGSFLGLLLVLSECRRLAGCGCCNHRNYNGARPQPRADFGPQVGRPPERVQTVLSVSWRVRKKYLFQPLSRKMFRLSEKFLHNIFFTCVLDVLSWGVQHCAKKYARATKMSTLRAHNKNTFRHQGDVGHVFKTGFPLLQLVSDPQLDLFMSSKETAQHFVCQPPKSNKGNVIFLAIVCWSKARQSHYSDRQFGVMSRTRPELEERLKAARESIGTHTNPLQQLAQQVPIAISRVPAAISHPVAALEQLLGHQVQ